MSLSSYAVLRVKSLGLGVWFRLVMRVGVKLCTYGSVSGLVIRIEVQVCVYHVSSQKALHSKALTLPLESCQLPLHD